MEVNFAYLDSFKEKNGNIDIKLLLKDSWIVLCKYKKSGLEVNIQFVPY